MRLLSEKIANLRTGLKTAGTNLQILIRRADDRSVLVEELQNLARLVRSDIHGTLMNAKGTERQLQNWQFGMLLDSGGTNGEEED